MVYLIVTFTNFGTPFWFKFRLILNVINNYKTSNACKFMNSLALKLYEARHLKKSFTGQILYRSLDPSKKRRQNIFYQKIWFYSNFPLVLSDVPYKIEKKSSHFPGFLIFFKILKTIKENGLQKICKMWFDYEWTAWTISTENISKNYCLFKLNALKA